MKTKGFPIGDIVATMGYPAFSADGMGGIYRVLSWMAQEPAFTHQLSRVFGEAERYIRDQCPFLCEIETPATEAAFAQNAAASKGLSHEEQNARSRAIAELLLAPLVARWGATWILKPMHMDDHAVIDPVEEVEVQIGKERVIVIE